MSKLSIKVTNKLNEPAEIEWNLSSVKVKGGTYKIIGGGTNTCAPNASVEMVDNALFGAGANRRYRIHYSVRDNDAIKYYPSESSYTDDPTPTITIS